MADNDKMLHDEHRKRLKAKFAKCGADGLSEHEFVEMLLFYALPRKNTNEIAHLLVNEFGGLRGILDADVESIAKIKGISYHTALMFRLIACSVKKYVNDTNEIIGTVLTPMNVQAYVKNLFYGHPNEIAYLILMDNQCVVKKVKQISAGNSNSTPIYTRDIVKLTVNERYPYVILAHNHPNGNILPSNNDMQMTKKLEMALSFIDVRLVDHIIVAGEKVTSLLRHFNAME